MTHIAPAAGEHINRNHAKGSTTLQTHAKAQPKRQSWFSGLKSSLCCCCAGEAPAQARASKANKALHGKPAPKPSPSVPVSSGEAGAAPRITPVPGYGPVSEARAFPKVEDAIDFRHWR